MISTSIHGIVQNGSVLFFDENNITIHCTISNPTYTVEWYYRTLIDGNVTDVTSLSIFYPQTGISSLDVNSNQLGYYDCITNRDSVYTVYLVHNSSLGKLMRYMYCIRTYSRAVASRGGGGHFKGAGYYLLQGGKSIQ